MKFDEVARIRDTGLIIVDFVDDDLSAGDTGRQRERYAKADPEADPIFATAIALHFHSDYLPLFPSSSAVRYAVILSPRAKPSSSPTSDNHPDVHVPL